jgi:alanine-glyoxylate transaminase/serine-glyoxylate transaminase/serine-pyruvate transaminase
MIPGPCEFHEDVMRAMSTPSVSHVDPIFIKEFGSSLSLMRKLFKCQNGQPFVLSGSGTLGWDVICSNLLNENDKVLVLNCGVFGDRFVDCLKTYNCVVVDLKTEIGAAHSLQVLEKELVKQYKMITITHVDTSTGVLSNVKEIAMLVKKVSPNTLIAVDGVCSIGGEELDMDSWGVDIAMTGSQKSIGVPAGLCLVMASPRAIQLKKPCTGFYVSWDRWIPIMKAYENNTPSYFATPAVHLIRALYQSLLFIVEKVGVDQYVKAHQNTAKKVHAVIKELGLKLVSSSPSNTMTAVYYEKDVKELLKKMSDKGIVIAGGLHPAIKYFRVGHMGISALPEYDYVDKTLKALKESV